jgi:hypothetical protein
MMMGPTDSLGQKEDVLDAPEPDLVVTQLWIPVAFVSVY